MSLLIFAYRKQDIIQRKSKLNLKLMELQKKMFDLQSYASSIADGVVSMSDLLDSPASVFGRMSKFMFYSHGAALAGAQQKFGFLSQTPGAIPTIQDPQMQQQYQQMMFNKLYEQERERFSKFEQKILNKEDTKIQQEISKIQTQLKMLESEEQNVTQAEEKAAANSAPKYVA